MHIVLESKDEAVVSMLENKLNENDKYNVFDVKKEMGDDYIGLTIPVFQKFVYKFNEMKLRSKEGRKNIIVEGLGDFLSKARISLMENAYIQWNMDSMGFCAISSGEGSFFGYRFPTVDFSPVSDFYKDLKRQLDEIENEISSDYLFKTYNALNAEGYFLGNFHTNEIISVPINGRKLYFKDVLKTIYENRNENSSEEKMVKDFYDGKISFVKKDHPFAYFVLQNAENKHSN